MNSIEQKFIEKAKKEEDIANEVVKEAVLLLEDHAADERRILNAVGLNAELKIIEKAQESKIIRSKNKEIYGKTILHISEIEDLLKKYCLSMKKPDLFRGKLPKELPYELKNFINEHNIPLSSSSRYNSFYVIAPDKMFSDHKSIGHIIKEAWKETGREVKEKKRLAAIKNDPLLVLELPEQPGYYAIIKSWGNDFSWIRRIYEFFSTPKAVGLSIKLFRILLNIGIIYSIYVTGSNLFVDNMTFLKGFGLFITGIALILTLVIHIFTDASNIFFRYLRRDLPHEARKKD